jgi:hypothetical protein
VLHAVEEFLKAHDLFFLGWLERPQLREKVSRHYGVLLAATPYVVNGCGNAAGAESFMPSRFEVPIEERFVFSER